METTNRPWLDRLKQHLSTAQREDVATKMPMPRADKTDTTPPLDSSVGCVGASGEAFGEEVAWRTAAFRHQLPQHGPILPLYARQEARGPRQPGTCGSCGDFLTEGRVYTCAPCQRAAWIALGMSEPAQAREGEAA